MVDVETCGFNPAQFHLQVSAMNTARGLRGLRQALGYMPPPEFEFYLTVGCGCTWCLLFSHSRLHP
jgi:hypothetical protein